MAAVNFLRFLLLADNHIVNKVRNINRQHFCSLTSCRSYASFTVETSWPTVQAAHEGLIHLGLFTCVD